MFRFASPEWLLGLILVPVLALGFWLAGWRRRQLLTRFGEPDLMARLTDSVSRPARRVKAALQLVAVVFLFLAAARPQFGSRIETVTRRGQDIMVAVDLSNSMLAEDVSPNRLERARLAILRLLQRLDGDRIGLVAFAGDAFVQSPLTSDYSAAAMFLGAMEPDLMPVQGTAIEEAMRVALDALDQGAREDRILVLVTDGEDHEGEIQPQIQRAASDGVRIYTVGIGSAEGVPIPSVDPQTGRRAFQRDEDGNVVTTRLEETVLMEIAEATGGRYVRVAPGTTALEDLVDEVAAGEGSELESREVTQFEEQYQLFLAVAVVLLLTESFVPERRRVEGEWRGRFG